MPGAMTEGATSDEPDLNTFENKSGLAEDMKFLASMPELCDVTFLVGDTREPVCAVKAVLAARSRYGRTIRYGTRNQNDLLLKLNVNYSKGVSQNALSSSQSSEKKRTCTKRKQTATVSEKKFGAFAEPAKCCSTSEYNFLLLKKKKSAIFYGM